MGCRAFAQSPHRRRGNADHSHTRHPTPSPQQSEPERCRGRRHPADFRQTDHLCREHRATARDHVSDPARFGRRQAPGRCIGDAVIGDMIGDPGATRPEWRIGRGRIRGGLMLELGIELGSEQQDVAREIEPGQRHHDRTERAVGRIVIAEIGDVDPETDRQRQPHQRREQRTRRQPYPARILPRRAIAVQRRRRARPGQCQQQIGDELPEHDDRIGRLRKHRLEIAERRDRDQRQDRHKHGGGGDAERQHIEPYETACFLLLIHDIERGDHGARPIARAKQRETDRKQQAEALLAVGRLDDVHQLFADQLGDFGGHHRHQLLHVVHHGRRLGGDAIDQHDRAEQRHEREKAVKGDASGDQTNIVAPRFGPGALCDAEPGLWWHLPRGGGVMPLRVQ